RVPRFRNADRLNTLLALIRAEMDGAASVAGYSKLLRAALDAADGRANPDWASRRDPLSQSSMSVVLADAQRASTVARARRHAPRKAAAYRARRLAYAAERTVLGLPPVPRGRPRIVRAQVSVAGKTVADFGYLVTEWHESMNGSLKPVDVSAGSGERIWWRCPNGPDHEWPAQVRSRALRGTGCPFCAHRAIAPSETLATSHPDIAVQWHSERNGDKTARDFSYGSHFEAWWQCPKRKSHIWRCRIASRTSMMSGCPMCSRAAKRGGRMRLDAEDMVKSA
ncbi:MAG: zinc-ribbon domain-containing protein, partial [Acidobacteriota bacterium]